MPVSIICRSQVHGKVATHLMLLALLYRAMAAMTREVLMRCDMVLEIPCESSPFILAALSRSMESRTCRRKFVWSTGPCWVSAPHLMSLATLYRDTAAVLRAPLMCTMASWAARLSNLLGAVTKS